MSNSPKNKIGLFDWPVALAMIIFVVLMFASRDYELEFLKYIAFIPAVYGILRTFSKSMG